MGFWGVKCLFDGILGLFDGILGLFDGFFDFLKWLVLCYFSDFGLRP